MTQIYTNKKSSGHLFIRTLSMIILYSLLISSVVVLFFYVISSESARNTYDMQYESILDSSRNSMDSTLQYITSTFIRMSEDSNFLDACISPSPVNYTKIRFNLLISANLAETVKEFTFYKIGSDKVISSGHQDIPLASYELGSFLHDYLEGQLTCSYMTYNNCYISIYPREDELILIRDFPIQGNKHLGVILCRVDRYSLYSWYKRSQGLYGNQLYVFDREGSPVFENYMEYDDVVLSSYESFRKDGITQITSNARRMYYAVSSSSGWSFLLSTTQNSPLGTWSESAQYLPLILAIIALLSLGISIFLRNTIVAPLQRMVSTFCDYNNIFHTSGKNELEQLSTTFSEILNSRNRLNTTLNDLIPTISNQFFTELLCKKTLDHDYIQRTLITVGSKFTPEGVYALVVLNERTENQSLYPVESLRDTTEKALGHYMLALAEKRIQWLDVPRHMVILLQCSPEVNSVERLFLLSNICQVIYSAISQQHPQIQWRHTIFCGQLSELCINYSHILTVPDHLNPFLADENASQMGYSYIHDRVGTAIALFEGDIDETQQILSSCINSVSTLCSSAQAQYDLMQIFEHVLKEELCKSANTAISELASVLVYNYDTKLSTSDNTVAYRQALLSYCSTVCSRLLEYNVKRNHKSLVAAQKYIMLHYLDNSLSLESVAEAVKINSTYLSKLFVNNIGISFVQYINDLRIEKACLLLQNSDMPVKDIADAVGFNSQQNFFRVFKKARGITPRQFKDIGIGMKN